MHMKSLNRPIKLCYWIILANLKVSVYLFFFCVLIVVLVALKDKEKNGALFSSIISAAQRKVKRKTTKGSGSLNESKEEVTSPNDSGGYSSGSFSYTDLKDVVSPSFRAPLKSHVTLFQSTTDGKTSVIPTTVTDMEKVSKAPPEKVPWFNYSTDREDFHKRIENFKQETEAMLQMPRNVEISVNNIRKYRLPALALSKRDSSSFQVG